MTDCPFCRCLASGALTESNEHAAAFPDAFPVSPGHTLVVPRRHVVGVYECSAEEQAAMWSLVARVRERLVAETGAEGFNIGVNDGAAAGQTMEHAHIHVIPRRSGDVPDPRGGIRWVLPQAARYWNEEGG